MIENMNTTTATVQEPLQDNSTKQKSAVSSRPRATRRVHGLQLPLHPLQLIGWIVILVTTFITFYFVIPSLSEPLRIIITVPFTLLYLLHSVAHIAALILDPAELELRKLDRSSLPEFDRTKHVHVIENGRCHLCNIHTSSLKTKHCSICNKCVDKFDHHCKWLNHCVGKRNYLAFFVTVITAAVLAFTVALICIAEVTIYYCNPQWLSWPNDSRVNATDTFSAEVNSVQYKKYVIYISILVMFSLVTVTLGTLLVHLCLFHIYISYIGITTYEYIRNNKETSSVLYCTCNIETCRCSKNYGCLAKIPNVLDWKIRKRRKISNFCAVKKSKVGDVSVTKKEQRARKQSGSKISSGQHHVASLRASIIENQNPNILKPYTSDIENNVKDTSIPNHAQILKTFFLCNYKNKRRKSIYRDRDKVCPTVEIQLE